MDLAEAENNQIVHLPTGISVTIEQLLKIISCSRVIYVGETHDNLEAHRVQLEIIRRLFSKFPGRIAVGMEMFRLSSQDQLDQWHQGTFSESEFERLFRQNWGSGYKPYQPLFDYLREVKIPLLGLKSTKETQNRLRQKGLDFPNSRDIFPEMDLNDLHHKTYSMAVFGGHDNPSNGSTSAYRMLVLWEETMAETVSNFLKNNKYDDWKLIVLAGGFHVQYGFGIPKRAFRRYPHAYSVILPTVTHIPQELEDRKMEVEEVPIPLYAADFAWKVLYKVLPKDRINLGVFFEELENGLLIKAVQKGSNAAMAGIQKDDVILQMDGQKITGKDDFVEWLQLKKIGDQISLKLWRAGNKLNLEITLAQNTK